MGFHKTIDIGENWKKVEARKWRHKTKNASITIKGSSPEYEIHYELPSGTYIQSFEIYYNQGKQRKQELKNPKGEKIDRVGGHEKDLMSPLKSAKLQAKMYMKHNQNASPPKQIVR